MLILYIVVVADPAVLLTLAVRSVVSSILDRISSLILASVAESVST